MSTPPTPRSPLIPVAARTGLVFGLVLVLMYVARIVAFWLPLLIFIYYACTIIAPVMAFRITKGYRDSFYLASPFTFRQGFSFVFLLHAFGGILAFLPQYFYFSRILPTSLETLEEQMRQMAASVPGWDDTMNSLMQMTPWQWLWSDYCLLLVMGALWGIVVGLILRRN